MFNSEGLFGLSALRAIAREYRLMPVCENHQYTPPAEPRPPLYPPAELESIIPTDPRKSFDMREVISRIVDGSEFREFKKEYGKTVITVSLVWNVFPGNRSSFDTWLTGFRRDTWLSVCQAFSPDGSLSL